ncbi:MAG TPA: hypothetical protein VFI98_09085 [Pseudolabrys sp.]|nr:hypothetical protein [Pseudolabrys sp.]
MRTPSMIVLLAMVAVFAGPARAQNGYDILGDNYSIMKPEKGARPAQPEPWLAPKYRSPHGTVKHVTIPRTGTLTQPRAAVPPPIVVPQTGRVLPNLPTTPGSGPGGSETFQDRAVRCTHQAGVYGQAAGDRNSYIGTCVNQ